MVEVETSAAYGLIIHKRLPAVAEGARMGGFSTNSYTYPQLLASYPQCLAKMSVEM
jgi:hypothetical protein